MDLDDVWKSRGDILRRKWNKEFSSTKIKFFNNAKASPKVETFELSNLKDKRLQRCLKGDSLVDDKYVNGETLFHIFARENNADMIRELFKNNFKIQVDDYGFYPWHTAAALGALDALKVFAEEKCEIHNKVEAWGINILHIAAVGIGARSDRIEVIEYVTDTIPEICTNMLDKFGRTPLILCALYDKEDEGEVLLDRGADPTIIPVYGITAVGISALNSPDLCEKLLTWVLKKKDEGAGIVSDFPTMLDITYIYMMGVSEQVILHPYMKTLVEDVSSGKMLVIQTVMLLLSLIDIVTISFLCMTNELSAKQRTLSTTIEVVYFMGLIWSGVALITVIITTISQLRLVTGGFSKLESREEYEKLKYHPYVDADKNKVISQVKKMLTKTRLFALSTTAESTMGILARSLILAYQFRELEDVNKAYALSFALTMMWWKFFSGMEEITILPSYLLVMGMTVKKCILAVLEIMVVTCVIASPFIMVFVKLTIIEERVLYTDGNNISQNFMKDGERVFYAYHHIFRLMTVDNYHDYDFENKHHVFFSIFYPILITIYSLVILNMCIAKLSWLYKTIVSSAEYHLMRERLIMKIFWDNMSSKIAKRCKGHNRKIKHLENIVSTHL